MFRVRLFTFALLLAALLGCALNPAAAQPAYRISAAQIQQVLAQRFPVRYPVQGLLDLQVQAPRLRFMAAENRLGAEFDVQAAGPALRRGYTGSFDMEFALRYEPSDQTIRAHQLRVNALRLPGMPPRTTEMLEALLPALTRDSLGELVVHRLAAKELALADTMGLQPDTITVTADALVIGFSAKPRP